MRSLLGSAKATEVLGGILGAPIDFIDVRGT